MTNITPDKSISQVTDLSQKVLLCDNSKDPLTEKVMKLTLKEEELSITEYEGFKRICKNGKLALYMSDQLSHFENLVMPCNMISIETTHINRFAMILSRHNPFTDLINFQLQKFIDNGMINRLKYRSFKKEFTNVVKHQPNLRDSLVRKRKNCQTKDESLEIV
uniref:Uncharacterized protein n=1 Tax=Vespula pensylvanica TaxID=30213 RepID=A0A834K315_VESPE|nr:hypothetical protein H0235_016299 [Vespula pensylvanica]